MTTARPFALGAAASALLLAACASTPGDGAAEPPAPEAAEVRDASGSFRASLSRPFEQESEADGMHGIELPIERSVPIYCHVWPEETAMGVTALRLSRLLFQRITASGEVAVAERQIASLEAGVIGGTAYQSIKTAFRLASGDEVGVGLMKVSVANKQGRGITCNHWDTGHVDAFDGVFEELVGSFEAADAGPEPYYRDVSRYRTGDLDLGIVVTSFTRDAEGDVEAVSRTSMIVPTSPSELAVSYSKTVDWSEADGNLINAYALESDAETEHTRLGLEWDAEAGWRVAGLFRGEEIEATLEHDGPIASMLADALVMTEVLRPHGERSNATLVHWMPNARPDGVVAVPYAVDPDDADVVRSSVAGIEMEISRDAEGLAQSSVVRAGELTMTLTRIHREGGP